jgi:putative Holliday junction resolvase
MIEKGNRILGFDYGLKRTGIAVSDELHITCSPVTTLDTNEENFLLNLQKLINEYKIKFAVVGIPFTKDGKKTEFIHEIEKFIQLLKSSFNLTVYTIDESFSSKKANQVMLEINKKRNKRKQKGNIDKIAAALILQEFLDNL